MDGNGRDDAGAGGLPWSSLLDPVANAKALGDVQARGLRAASDLVERLVRSVDGERVAGATEPSPTAEGNEPSGDGSRLLEVWIDLLRRTADSFGRLGDRPAAGPASGAAASVDVGTGIVTGEVHLRVGVDGASADGAELWVHNGTSEPLAGVRLHTGDLRTADGSRLDAVVTFDPAELTEVPARSSRGVAVGVAADCPLAPGTYRALVQAAGAPEVWLALEVVVDDA